MTLRSALPGDGSVCARQLRQGQVRSTVLAVTRRASQKRRQWIERIRSSPVRTWGIIGGVLIAAGAIASWAVSGELSRTNRIGPLTSEKTAEGEKIFQKMDKNRDGFISREEYGIKHESRFDRIDTNGDGTIDRDEWRAWFAQREPHAGHSGKALGRNRGKAGLKAQATNTTESDRSGPPL